MLNKINLIFFRFAPHSIDDDESSYLTLDDSMTNGRESRYT